MTNVIEPPGTALPAETTGKMAATELLPQTVEESTEANGVTDEIVGWSLLQMYGKDALESHQTSNATSDVSQLRDVLQTLPERLAETLLTLSAKRQRGIIHGIALQTLADTLGTYRETVASLLRAFRRQGLVEVRYQYIRVVDPVSLREFCDYRD